MTNVTRGDLVNPAGAVTLMDISTLDPKNGKPGDNTTPPVDLTAVQAQV